MSIEETLAPVAPPLRMDEGGTLRVGKTRVRLDTVVGAYLDGSTAEQIKDSFDTLSESEIYAVLNYYLNHREEVHAYLERQRLRGEEVRRTIEELCPPDDYRERLLARRRAQQ